MSKFESQIISGKIVYIGPSKFDNDAQECSLITFDTPTGEVTFREVIATSDVDRILQPDNEGTFIVVQTRSAPAKKFLLAGRVGNVQCISQISLETLPPKDRVPTIFQKFRIAFFSLFMICTIFILLCCAISSPKADIIIIPALLLFSYGYYYFIKFMRNAKSDQKDLSAVLKQGGFI